MSSGFAPFQHTPRLNPVPQIGAFQHLNSSSKPNSNVARQPSHGVHSVHQNYPPNNSNSSSSQGEAAAADYDLRVERVDRQRGKSTMAQFAEHVASLEAESDAHAAEARKMRALLEKYKGEAIKAQKQKLMMCFDHASSNLLGYAFSEWKELTREEGKVRLRYEMEMKLKAETERANKQLREHEAQLEQQLFTLHEQFNEERQGHLDDIRIRDLEIQTLNEKLSVREQEFADLKTALAKANRFFLTFSEQALSLRELSESARAALEEDEDVKQQARFMTVRTVVDSSGGPSNMPSADYMKDTLHDLLAKVDGRYMPRMFKNPMEERDQQLQSRAAQQYFETVPQPHTTIMQQGGGGGVLDRSGRGNFTPVNNCSNGGLVRGGGPFGTGFISK